MFVELLKKYVEMHLLRQAENIYLLRCKIL